MEQKSDATPASDHLAQYLTEVRRDRTESATASEVASRVEAIFDELQLPWSKEPGQESWKIASNVGTINAGLDDEHEVVTFSQFIHDWTGKAKKEADYMQTLLRLNRHTGGACFAIFGEPGDPAFQ